VVEAVKISDDVLDTALVSPVFGDIAAKVTSAVRQEVERRLRLGLPVSVDRGRGVETLGVGHAER